MFSAENRGCYNKKKTMSVRLLGRPYYISIIAPNYEIEIRTDISKKKKIGVDIV